MDKADLTRRMEGALDSLKSDYAGLRTGRASASMLEPIVVDVYGSKMPMNQVGNITVPESRMLTVQVWDASAVSAVEKAIRESGLGLNPQSEGSVVRVPIPELNEERRKELTKVAGQYAESARVAIRNVRRDGMDSIKNNKEYSEDDKKRLEKEVQELTDAKIKIVDAALSDKEKDIMTV
ncbi:MAG: ribosome recycling factor [Alphaproteobacteria bacterium]|nr:ribosome recycling factor [Alphaproteobacteria bacterium]NCQ88075.1 ribosome recycling factor [Alphaproteobacteria bacterium]NCT05418.1 ribosome recycling factor [Alphaproteobacteria bacterium]